MGLIAHREIEAGNVHSPFQFIYVDEAERLADTDFETSDLYCLAMQESDYTMYVLTSLDPVTWVQLATV